MREGSTAAVLNSKGEILLQLRSDVPIWALPGGKIEYGETPAAAAVREVFEETGLKVKPKAYVGRYFLQHRMYGHSTHLFLCKVISGRLRKNRESIRLGFFNVNQLPKPLLQIFRERIADALAGKTNVRKVQRAPLPKVLKETGFNPLLLAKALVFVMNVALQKIYK